MTDIPELEHHCSSWIVVNRETGKAVLETFNRATAAKINLERYQVLTAAQYLGRLS